MVILAPPSPDPAQNGDFSEYFWMENEEEFDRQVLKELEEEALMEQCMQAMIDDNTPDSPPTPWQQEDSNSMYIPEAQNGPNSSELIMAMRGLQVNGDAAQDQAKSEVKANNHEFKFNPMAKEFIPGMPFYRPSGQTSDRSPQFSELVDNQPDA